MSDRTPLAVQHISQRPSAVLLLVGALMGLVGNALHPHVAQSADLALRSDAWVASPASDSAAALRLAAAVNLVDFGIWSVSMLV